MFSLLKKLNNIFFNNEKNIKKNIIDDFNQIKTRKNKNK
jgi:hypothetical protein